MAARRRRGEPQDLRDSIIAVARRATIATRDVRHFADLDGAPLNPREG